MKHTGPLFKTLLLLVLLVATFGAQAATPADSTTTTDSLRTLTWTGDTAITVRLDAKTITTPTLPADYTGTPTYSASNPAVATIDSLGVVKLLSAGTDTITADCPADSLYSATRLSYVLQVLPALKPLTWATGDTAITVRLDADSVSTPTLPADYTGTPVYSASNPEVATIDSLGVVKLLSAGTDTITADCPADSLYSATRLSYVLQVLPALKPLTWATGDTVITVRLNAQSITTPTLPADYTGKPTYSVSDTTVATIDSLGQLTLHQVGTDTIIADCPADSLYQHTVLSYSITVLDSLRSLHFTTSQLTYDLALGEGSFMSPSLPADYTGQPTYVSGNTSVATVNDDGIATLVGDGVAEITVDCPADSLYAAATLSYVLRVGAASGTRFYGDGIIVYYPNDSLEVQTEFIILDSKAHTVALGSGSSPAIDTEYDGTFVCPSTVLNNEVPYTVVAVNANALQGCTYLEGVSLPATVKWMGNDALRGDYRIFNVDLGSGIDSIASGAFYGCTRLQGITLPASLRHLATDALGSNNYLRYVDARPSTKLQLTTARDDGSPFASLNSDVLLYMPTGSTLTGTNVINTDSAGVMTSERITIGGATYAPAQCASGELTYDLNNINGDQVFGQRLGTDAYPVPSTLPIIGVHRVLFYVADTLRYTGYSNHNRTMVLPTADTLGITTGYPAFFYYSNGKFTSFGGTKRINGDMTVMVYAQHPAGQAGHVFLADVTIIPSSGAKRAQQAMFQVIDAASHTAQLGIGTYSAVPSAPGQVIVPTTVADDTVTYRVTGIAPRAFKGITGLRGIELPASLKFIGSQAFIGCSQLLTIALPGTVDSVGTEAWSGASRLRYIDARQASGWAPDTLSRSAGTFSGTSLSTYVYAPQGLASADSTLQNFIFTDSVGTLSCSHFLLAGKELTPDTCRSGYATWALNAGYGTTVMGQRLGRDAYPLPLAADSCQVHRIQFVVGDTLVAVTNYANRGSQLQLPTASQLGFATSGADFYYVDATGVEVLVPDSMLITADLTISALPRSAQGEDGYIFTAPAQLTPTGGEPQPIDATFRVTSYARRQVVVGDGRHNAIALSSEGHLAIPDSVVLDSTTFAVTGIARQAFKASPLLTQVTLPATLVEIEDSAFAHCTQLQRLTLPASVTTLGRGLITADCSELSYVDLRAATAIPASVISADGALANRPAEALVYLPVGIGTVQASNVVCTDSLGQMSCKEIWVDRITLTGDDLTSGRAAWMLCDWALRPDFGQRIGTDPCPVPATDSTARPVRRIKVLSKQYVIGNAWVNEDSLPTLPTAEQMGYADDARRLIFQAYNPDSARLVPFDASLPVKGDTAVWASYANSCDLNADGIIDVADVTFLVDVTLGTAGTEKYRGICDLNADGIVDVADVTLLVGRILQGTAADSLSTALPPKPAVTSSGRRDLNVFILGNSFSLNAYNYMPFVLYNVAPDIRLHAGHFSINGGRLNQHLQNILSDTLYYGFYRYRGSFTRSTYWWTPGHYKTTFSQRFAEYPWDMLLIQQASGLAGDVNTYSPSMQRIIHIFKHRSPRHVDVGFLLTHTYPDGSFAFREAITYGNGTIKTSEQMYNCQTQAAQLMLSQQSVDFVIPAGTAIQNARTTPLDTLGCDYYHQLASDKLHLQDGAAKLAESYVVTESILRYLGRTESIWDEKSTLPITDNWVKSHGCDNYALPVMGMEPSNVEWVKKSVRAAIERPFEKTVIPGANSADDK